MDKTNKGTPQATNACREPIDNGIISSELGEKVDTRLRGEQTQGVERPRCAWKMEDNGVGRNMVDTSKILSTCGTNTRTRRSG